MHKQNIAVAKGLIARFADVR